jgi:hypothetical protein
MDVPGYGRVEGEWDLRGKEAQYLGGVRFKGKRVLELGTASGHLCFYMEKQGAEVVAFDLSPDQEWDMVPYSRLSTAQCGEMVSDRKAHVGKVNNGFWLAHHANHSQAKVVYGSVYEVPEAIGEVDISVFGSLLLHLRDPVLALQQGARLARETVVVTDWCPSLLRLFMSMARILRRRLPVAVFLPDYRICTPKETWWHLAPSYVEEVLGMLGFENTRVSYATYNYRYLGRQTLYTVVGHRAKCSKPSPPF